MANAVAAPGAAAPRPGAWHLSPQHSLWALALCILLAEVLVGLGHPSLTGLLAQAARVNLILLGALLLLAHLCLQLTPSRPNRPNRPAWRRHALYGLVTTMLALASAKLMLLGLFACWWIEWALNDFEAPVRGRTALLAAALAFNMLIAPQIFRALGEHILRWDALVVYGVAKSFDPGLLLNGTALRRESGFGVVMVGACSSFNALSLASLAYVAYVVFRGRTLNRRDWAWLVVMSLLMVGFNAVRISLCAISREAYTFWHIDPIGLGILTLAMHVVLAAGCWVGDRLCSP
ncbi:MAG: hypothetical protein RI907_2743 [Pseudomonadota bacterium]